MMNFSSLFAIVTPFFALMSGIAAAREMKASFMAVLLSALAGLVVGVGVAIFSVGSANAVLTRSCREKRKLATTGYGLAYFFVPLILLAVACVVTVFG